MRLNKNSVITAYLFFMMMMMPLLTPLRGLGVLEPSLLKIVFLPVFIGVFILLFNPVKILLPNSWFKFFLFGIFIQTAVVGWQNVLNDGEIRAYASHLFQLFSAYVMFGVGREFVDNWSKKKWESIAKWVLISVAVSTFITISFWTIGLISRYYSPAYTLLFVGSIGLSLRNKLSLFSFFLLLMSNKRGPLLSFVLCVLFDFLFVRKKSYKRVLGSVIFLSGILIAGSVFVNSNAKVDLPIVQAVSKTFERMSGLFELNDLESVAKLAGAARADEVISGLNAIDSVNFFTGNGAGWTGIRESGRKIQNIHVTPISFVVVFGVFFSIGCYFYFSVLITRCLRMAHTRGLPFFPKFCLFYLLGAVLHSLVAYSLFIDLLVFFCAGYLSKRSNLLSPQELVT